MNLLRTAALWVPAIRRLHEDRNALLAERDDLLMRTAPGAEGREAAEARIARLEGRLITTDYPYHPHNRPIEDAGGGRRLTARLRAEEDRYAATLRGVARHIGSLLRIPRAQEDPSRPFSARVLGGDRV